MEKIPSTPDPLCLSRPAGTDVVGSDWRQHLPVLAGTRAVLRELRASDAPSLLAALTPEEVSRFISPPPTTAEGFERFIAWTHRERTAGASLSFAVTVAGDDTAIGVFQMRETEPGFGTAEWGCVLGPASWGTGVFRNGAELLIEFGFDVLGVHRLEARAAVLNDRGNAALRSTGAVKEGVLRRSFLLNGEYLDQAIYGIVADEWRASRGAPQRWPSRERRH